MKKSDYQSFKQADQYYRLRFSNLSQVNQDEMLLLEKWLKDVGTKKIHLDLGTGTGRIVTILLKHHPKKIYALDQSEAMLKYLNHLYKKEVEAKKIRTVKATSSKIPVNSSTIDIITAFHLFKHLPDIEPTLKEADRILKKGGYLIFDALNTNSLIRFNLGTCFALSDIELFDKLSKNGFIIHNVAYLHNFGETVYNLLGLAAKIIQPADLFMSEHFKIGTKIFVLAKKYG